MLQAQNRPASPQEQAVLAKWGAWGAQGLWQVLDEQRSETADDRAKVRRYLTEADFAAAKLTTINAHYTDAGLVTAMWSAVTDLGFTGGRVLEPGCGSGTFVGLAPDSAVMTGVELDATTAAIASYLYPQATILNESFADTRFPNDHFDLTIGNVPFANVVLHDPAHNRARLSLHNHFIVKSLELTRPGGLVAVLTSRYTMDASNPAARHAIADLADLVTAVRLPSSAHWRAAGTEAVSDLLILRRRPAGQQPDQTAWMGVSPVMLPGPNGEEPIRINEYWQQNPDQVLGSSKVEVGMHGTGELVVQSRGPLDQVPAQLGDRLAINVAAAVDRGMGWLPPTAEQQDASSGWVQASRDRVEGELIARPQGIFEVEDGGEVQVPVPKTQIAEVRALLELRDQAKALIAAEASTVGDDPALEEQRGRLLHSWKGYVNRYGPIGRYTLRRTGRNDPDTGEEIQAKIMPRPVALVTSSTYGTAVAALEVFDDLTQTAEPATMLKHRVIVPRQPVQGVDSAADGLAVVLDTVGRVDLDQIAVLRGTSHDEVIAELGDRIYQVPGAEDEWQTRAHYLSGNVRAKLDAARAAAQVEPERWAANVAALEAVLPADLGPAEISVRLGAPWIPDTDHEQFLKEILNAKHGVKVVHLVGSTWDIEAPTYSVEATSEWGIRKMPAGKLVAALIAQRRIAVFDRIDDREILNVADTEAAQEKARLLQERFASWLWEDPERTARLVESYNRIFNSVVLRDYTEDGAALTLPGLVKNFTPHPHQRTAVARMINEPSVGLFHVVGAGKTAEMAMGAMELRRLGLVRKPAVIVPNHMLAQFSREWLQLYPQAKILAASSQDLTADRRRRLVAKIAANDWDAVIITHGAFQRIGLSAASEADYTEKRLALIREQAEKKRELRGDSAGFKRLEKKLLAAEQRLVELRSVPVDPGISFEETGIDYLIVDELHLFKNLQTVSSIPDAQITGSKRASDLDAKLNWLRETNGERVITGATATPIANSITEMHVLQRYMNPASLEAAGLDDFDAWAANFGEVVTAPEISVAGGNRFKMKSRFARFVNLPELLTLFHQFADVKTADDLNLPRPQIAARASDGKRAPEIVLVPPTPELKAYVADLGERSDAVAAGAVEPTEDNMLKISGDGRKAGLAMRLVDPASTDTGKVETAADHLIRVWEATRDNRYTDPETGEPSPIPGALQLVFCDLATPTRDRWNVYDELKAALIARGMPADKIRFIHEARNDAEKGKLFAAARAGHVAVLMGSTEKMGVGTNVQARAVHLLDIDAPWRPADVEQRHGRIVRQGNQNPEVKITQLVTEGSFDAYMWQTLERKARFIDQILSGRLDRRETGDIGEATLSAGEVKALASGNPLLLEYAAAGQELSRLSRLERTHAATRHNLQDTIRWSEQDLTRTRARITNLIDMETRTKPTSGDQFRFWLTEQQRWSTDRAEVAAILNRKVASLRRMEVATIGELGGHQIEVMSDLAWDPSGRSRVDLKWRLTEDDAVSILTSFRPGSDTRHVEVGTIIRLEHLVASVPAALERAERRVDELEHTLEQARRLVDLPFRHADALVRARRVYEDLGSRMSEFKEQPAIDHEQSEPRDPRRPEDQPVAMRTTVSGPRI